MIFCFSLPEKKIRYLNVKKSDSMELEIEDSIPFYIKDQIIIYKFIMSYSLFLKNLSYNAFDTIDFNVS